MLTLLLVCSFSPRVHSIPRGPHILKNAHQDDVLFLLYGTIYGQEPENLFSAFGGCLQTLALCTVCNFADTLRRFAVYPRFALCRARPVVPRHKLRFWPNKRILFVCLSYACLFLIPTGTKYPAGSPLTSLLTKQTHFICLFVLCLFVPFPHGYTVSRGVPIF